MATVLSEASGSLVSSYLIRSIKEAGHKCIASDILSECASALMADAYVKLPPNGSPELWSHVEKLIVDYKIDYVLPSLDATLMEWAERKAFFQRQGVSVIISPVETIATFSDKWNAYKFFQHFDIPSARTSLEPEFPLVKPRSGSGSKGLFIEQDVSQRRERFSKNDISQEILEGVEYTVDCLFDGQGRSVYIIPRRRLNVIDGKSLDGVVEKIDTIISLVEHLGQTIHLVGPVNVQVFQSENKGVSVVEVNPRIAGGMALSFAATKNWMSYLEDISNGKLIEAGEVKWGLKMFRTYNEIYG